MRKVRHAAAPLSELTPEEGKVIPLGEQGECLLVLHEGVCYALGSLCPHQNASLNAAPVRNGEVVCPRHRYRFDLRTGDCLTLGGYGLPIFETMVENGIVYVSCWEYDD